MTGGMGEIAPFYGRIYVPAQAGRSHEASLLVKKNRRLIPARPFSSALVVASL